MIRDELQSWLADRSRQQLAQQASDDFAREWDRGPVQQRFDRAMAALPEQSAEAVAAAIRALFADDGWVEVLIDRLARQLGADPFFEPPFRALNSDIHSGLILFEDERVTIAAGVGHAAELAARKNRKRGATSVGFTGRVTVLKFVRAGGGRISLWQAPRIDADFTASGAGRCARVGERDLVDGDILTFDGRCQGYVFEHVRGNFLVIQAEIALDQAPVSVEYDSASHCYVGCSATGDSASRIQMIATLLRKLGAGAAFEPMASFLGHPDFFVRWHVMRELLGLDLAAALPHLRRMAAADPHPETRRAARAVLDRLAAPPSRREAA